MEGFLKKLYNTDLKLSLLLLEAKNIAENEKQQELIDFIDKEINGYKIEDGIPDYRKIKSQIVGDIKDVYGNLQHKEYPIDFSLLSEKVGFDLDDAYMPDGISFVETSIENITGKNAIKPIPKKLVKMLDETFHHNNRLLHLVDAYHRIPTASLNYILVKVRQELIQAFQKIKRENSTEEEIVISEVEDKTDEIKVFVTYAWGSDEFNEKIISFVQFLRQNGFDASMDKKMEQEETSINFNEMMVRGINNSDKVIIVLSENYKERADEFKGGVGTEFKIIMEEMKTKKNKFIFVYFGGVDRELITPLAITGTNIIDLKKDQDETEFNVLFSKLKEENIIEFSEVNDKTVSVKKVEIKPFKL